MDERIKWLAPKGTASEDGGRKPPEVIGKQALSVTCVRKFMGVQGSNPATHSSE